MGSIHKYECNECSHKWEAWELEISSWECPICGSPELTDLGEVEER
jgi:rubrerythrin